MEKINPSQFKWQSVSKVQQEIGIFEKSKRAKDYYCNAICRSSEKAYNVFTVVSKVHRNYLNVKEVKNIEDVAAIKEAISECSAVIFVACGISFLGLFSNKKLIIIIL